MRPIDLKSPFSSRERYILIREKVLYYPKTCDPKSFQFPGWDHPDVFGRSAPIMLEYCSGNGAWIVEKALAHPELNWVALEMDFDRVRKIYSKRHNLNIENLFIICGEALRTSQAFIAEATIHDLFINFPDPWPKRRHAKYRLIQNSFVKELERILKKDAAITFVTDDSPYSSQFIKTLQQFPKMESHYETPYYVTDFPDYGNSPFATIWKKQGKDILYHRFRKKS